MIVQGVGHVPLKIITNVYTAVAIGRVIFRVLVSIKITFLVQQR